jgi:hypothetical protein
VEAESERCLDVFGNSSKQTGEASMYRAAARQYQNIRLIKKMIGLVAAGGCFFESSSLLYFETSRLRSIDCGRSASLDISGDVGNIGRRASRGFCCMD